MKYLPDNNIWIHYLNPPASPVKQKILSLSVSDILFCSVVKSELYFGAYNSNRKGANLALLAELFSQFKSLSFDDQAADTYGQIRADLTTKGTLIGPNDLMIASTALAYDVTLVTHNVREFSRVEGLKIENWEV